MYGMYLGGWFDRAGTWETVGSCEIIALLPHEGEFIPTERVVTGEVTWADDPNDEH